MEGAATPDRDALLAFELALDERVCDEVRTASWGRVFLTPSAPLIWDANWVLVERAGMALEEVAAAADEALGGAGFDHRTICLGNAGDGRRLGAELEARAPHWSRWQVERSRYMVWRGSAVGAPPRVPSPPTLPGPAREVPLAAIAGLRRAILAAEAVPAGVARREAIVDQLFALDQRYGAAGGDRWFAAPARGEPLSCCRLLRSGRIGQVEEVGTLAHARERGYAKATVLTAVAASRAAGDAVTFLTTDAADWPQLLYARLGFEPVGDLTILRRHP